VWCDDGCAEVQADECHRARPEQVNRRLIGVYVCIIVSIIVIHIYMCSTRTGTLTPIKPTNYILKYLLNPIIIY
jgi:hypothetical protein